MKPDKLQDQRLLGVWCSDKTQTLEEWIFSPGTPFESRAKFSALLGKLKIRYTPARIFTEFESDTTVCPYRVTAIDDDSVAIVRRTGGKNEIQHIHFLSENTYWITCGRNREFFVRMP
ncbi:hypothetical protein F8A86_11085 [Betaproteobacteria bacterium SCN1]|jgi:hypothetical protein|nr:hypothetical protein F8A86_11085 [Betaproteobacteria bacterium SCN1]